MPDRKPNLDPKTLNEVVDTLIPFCETTSDRTGLATQTLSGCNVLKEINYEGTTRNFVIHFVSTLLLYGDCVEGKPAVIQVLMSLNGRVDKTKWAAIVDLIKRIQTELGIEVIDEIPDDYESNSKTPGDKSSDDEPAHGDISKIAAIRKLTLQFLLWLAGAIVVALIAAYFTVHPSAAFIAEPMSGHAPLMVSLEENSDNAAGYFWDFDDGTQGAGKNIQSHEYTTPGTYTVELEVRNLYFMRDNATAIINVYTPQPTDTPEPSATITPAATHTPTIHPSATTVPTTEPSVTATVGQDDSNFDNPTIASPLSTTMPATIIPSATTATNLILPSEVPDGAIELTIIRQPWELVIIIPEISGQSTVSLENLAFDFGNKDYQLIEHPDLRDHVHRFAAPSCIRIYDDPLNQYGMNTECRNINTKYNAPNPGNNFWWDSEGNTARFLTLTSLSNADTALVGQCSSGNRPEPCIILYYEH